MHRPIFTNWNFVQNGGKNIDSDQFTKGLLSDARRNGKVNCRGMNITIQGRLREDSEYELDNSHPHQVMALKNTDAGIVALTETYSEIILA